MWAVWVGRCGVVVGTACDDFNSMYLMTDPLQQQPGFWETFATTCVRACVRACMRVCALVYFYMFLILYHNAKPDLSDSPGIHSVPAYDCSSEPCVSAKSMQA